MPFEWVVGEHIVIDLLILRPEAHIECGRSSRPAPSRPSVWPMAEGRRAPAPVASEDGTSDGGEEGRRQQALLNSMSTEYYHLTDIVTAFDQRILTIKGWSVTLSLATIALGFQQRHYGLFLVGGVSALAFWASEATTKDHEMNYYPRMRQLERASYELFGVDHVDAYPDLKEQLDTTPYRVSSPRIDWAWDEAAKRRDAAERGRGKPPVDESKRRSRTPFLVHVMFPHVIAVILGGVLFVYGISARLNGMPI